MRIYFSQIIKSYDAESDYKEGLTICDHKRLVSTPCKGEEMDMELMDINTGEKSVPCRRMGLGHYDFRDKKDYEARVFEVIKKKLVEVGLK